MLILIVLSGCVASPTEERKEKLAQQRRQVIEEATTTMFELQQVVERLNTLDAEMREPKPSNFIGYSSGMFTEINRLKDRVITLETKYDALDRKMLALYADVCLQLPTFEGTGAVEDISFDARIANRHSAWRKSCLDK